MRRIILFGLSATKKDATGSEAMRPGHRPAGDPRVKARGFRILSSWATGLFGFCASKRSRPTAGVIRDGDVRHDTSVYLLGKTAVMQARAGPSISRLERQLDGRSTNSKALGAGGFSTLPIMQRPEK